MLKCNSKEILHVTFSQNSDFLAGSNLSLPNCKFAFVTRPSVESQKKEKKERERNAGLVQMVHIAIRQELLAGRPCKPKKKRPQCRPCANGTQCHPPWDILREAWTQTTETTLDNEWCRRRRLTKQSDRPIPPTLLGARGWGMSEVVMED
jgi:hypothetical protein